jgi:hypothetical protein
MIGACLISVVPSQAQHHHRRRKVVVKTTVVRGGPLATVAAFEAAYHAKDKKTMIFKLMAPTQDAEALEKRYQWFRGYGPKDMPGTRHPPILFESSKGSFVPLSYQVSSSASVDPDHWTATVKEQGIYHDEDGNWTVIRLRDYKLKRVAGKWYVADYVLRENPEDYGFWVDDIVDKMTHVGK